MKNLTELLENGVKELEQIKTDQGILSWYIKVNRKSSLNTLMNQAEKICEKLNSNEKYSLKMNFTLNKAIFEGFNISFTFNDKDLPFAYSNREIFSFCNQTGLRLNFCKEGTPDEISDIVYEIYSGEIMTELVNAVREYYEPTRKLQNEYNDSVADYGTKRREFIREWVDNVSDWVENGNTIVFDEPTYVLGFGCMVKEFTLVKKPNRKTGRVMVKNNNNENAFDLFDMNKFPGSVVDILHSHFYFITDLNT